MKINRLLFFLLLCILQQSNISAQSLSRSVIGGAGDFYEITALGDYHFTLGEVAVEYFDSEEILAQGFHRLHRPLLSVSTADHADADFRLAVFPNPTADYLTVETDNTEKLDLVVTDILGRNLRKVSLNAGRHTLDLGDLPAGTYALSFYRENILLHSEKVQVIR